MSNQKFSSEIGTLEPEASPFVTAAATEPYYLFSGPGAAALFPDSLLFPAFRRETASLPPIDGPEVTASPCAAASGPAFYGMERQRKWNVLARPLDAADTVE
jgi:hypothetical protein